MTANIVNIPAGAERGSRTYPAEQVRLVNVNLKFSHSNGLQPRPKNIV